MKHYKKILKITIVAVFACFYWLNNTVSALYINNYYTNYNAPTIYSDSNIPIFETKKNIQKLYDNQKKIFDKDINITKNRIEYENLKEFLQVKKESLAEFDKIKFTNLTKTDILSYRKQIQIVKSSDGMIMLEKIIKTAKEDDYSAFYYKIGVYLYLTLGTFLGFLLFKFYTKKFLYRIQYIEEIPLSEEEALNPVDPVQEIFGETQLISGVDFVDGSIAQTLTIAQQDIIENIEDNWTNDEFKKVNVKKDNEHEEYDDSLIFSGLDKGDKK